jgi:GPH family glycoside/pentoside/hexuronide:cation symporter
LAEPSLRTELFYALPAVPLAALTLPLYIIVPAFYVRDFALSLAAVGQVLLLVRLADALSDPIAGYVADRWRPRFGRRRLAFLLACPPAAIAAASLFMPPSGAGLGWFALFALLLSLASTFAVVPYTAWGAELSASYAGRTRIAAFRETAAVLGTLLTLSAQAIVPLMGFPGERHVLAAIGLGVLVVLPLSALAAVAAVPEPRDHSRSRLSLGQGLTHMRRNRPFLRLLLAFFLNGAANGFPATLFLFFVGERLGAPAAAGPLLVIYFLCGIIGVPFWLRLAARTSKHRSWSIAMMIACVFFALALRLGTGDVMAFGVICVATGLALGADLLLPPAIQADVIDIDTLASGEQRAGMYFAVWGFATKLALASAAGIAFPLLARSGFDPNGLSANEPGLAMLSFLYCGLPVLLKVTAIAVMWNFPVDAATQAAVRQRIEATV